MAVNTSSVGMVRACALAAGEAATVFSGVAAAAMLIGMLYCDSATGGTDSNKLGYGYHDAASAFGTVSANKSLSQPIRVIPGSLMATKHIQAIQGRQDDRSLLRLIKDGLRAMTGLVLGNPADYPIGTAAETIGVRGSADEAWRCAQGPQCVRYAMLQRLDAVNGE